MRKKKQLLPRIHQIENFLKKKKFKLKIQSKEYMIREKAKKRERKWEGFLWKRESVKKLCFPRLQKNIILIRDATSERERFFSFFGKKPIENKPYFY